MKNICSTYVKTSSPYGEDMANIWKMKIYIIYIILILYIILYNINPILYIILNIEKPPNRCSPPLLEFSGKRTNV